MIYKLASSPTVVATALNFAVAYSRAFVLLDVCRACTNETRKSLQGAAPTRKSLREAVQRPSPFLIRWAPRRESPCRIRSAPGRDRERGLSETSNKCANFYILSGLRPSYSWILAYAELERKKHIENIYFQVGIVSKLASYFVPTTLFSWSHLEAFGLLSYDCCVVAFRYRISRLNTFVRAFVVFEGGRSLPNDIITPSVRADSSS